MKVTVNASELRSAVALAARIAPRKAPKPILTHLLLVAGADELTVTATNLDVGIQLGVSPAGSAVHYPCAPGRATVPAASLLEFFKGLPKGTETVSLETDDLARSLTLRADDAVATILGGDPADFPELPSFEDVEGPSAVLPTAELAAMVDRTAFAAAVDKTRYAVNGVLLEVRGRRFRLVATDGKRLALDERTLETGATKPPGFAVSGGEKPDVFVVVPTLALTTLARLPVAVDVPCRVYVTPEHVLLRTGRVAIFARFVEGCFPPYEDVLPTGLGYKLELDRKRFLSASKQVAKIAGRESCAVRYTFEERGIQMVCRIPEKGETSGRVAHEHAAPLAPLVAGFNPRFLEDALKTFEGERFAFELRDANSAAILRDPASATSLYVLMPIHLS